MVDKNYFHLLHRPFSLVKLTLHAFLFGGVCTIVYRAPSEYLQVFVTSCLRFCIYSESPVPFVFMDVVSVAVVFVNVSFFLLFLCVVVVVLCCYSFNILTEQSLQLPIVTTSLTFL